jgi:hypothetical protein
VYQDAQADGGINFRHYAELARLSEAARVLDCHQTSADVAKYSVCVSEKRMMCDPRVG